MSTKLPSRFTHGDKVSVNLQECGTLKNGEIQRVIFAEDKVSYDICFTIKSRHGDDVFTSYPVFPDVDSAFVKPGEPAEDLSAPASRVIEGLPEDIQQWIKREMAEYSENENEQISFYDGFQAYRKLTETEEYSQELEKVKEELRLCIRERNKYLHQLDEIAGLRDPK